MLWSLVISYLSLLSQGITFSKFILDTESNHLILVTFTSNEVMNKTNLILLIPNREAPFVNMALFEPAHEVIVLITLGDQRRLRRACAVSPEPSLFAQMVRAKIRSIAPLGGCECVFE